MILTEVEFVMELGFLMEFVKGNFVNSEHFIHRNLNLKCINRLFWQFFNYMHNPINISANFSVHSRYTYVITNAANSRTGNSDNHRNFISNSFKPFPQYILERPTSIIWTILFVRVILSRFRFRTKLSIG